MNNTLFKIYKLEIIQAFLLLTLIAVFFLFVNLNTNKDTTSLEERKYAENEEANDSLISKDSVDPVTGLFVNKDDEISKSSESDESYNNLIESKDREIPWVHVFLREDENRKSGHPWPPNAIDLFVKYSDGTEELIYENFNPRSIGIVDFTEDVPLEDGNELDSLVTAKPFIIDGVEVGKIIKTSSGDAGVWFQRYIFIRYLNPSKLVEVIGSYEEGSSDIRISSNGEEYLIEASTPRPCVEISIKTIRRSSNSDGSEVVCRDLTKGEVVPEFSVLNTDFTEFSFSWGNRKYIFNTAGPVKILESYTINQERL